MAEIQAIHECLFCPQTFETATAKDDHVLEHFAQETCMECNRNLIRIGASLYTKHDTSTCVKMAIKIEDHDVQPPGNNSLMAQDHSECVLSSQKCATGFVEDDTFSFTRGVSMKLEPQSSFNENSNDLMGSINDSSEFEVNELKPQPLCVLIEKSQSQSPSYIPELQVKVETMEPNGGQSFIDETCNAYTNTCEICGKNLSCKSALSVHKVLKHSSPSTIFCNLCGRLFSAIEDRDVHRTECALKLKMRKSKKSSPDLRCDVCNKPLKSDSIYRQHMQRIHNQRVIKFKCERCHATFLKESWLQEHQCTGQPITDINNKGPFVCEICQQSFVYKQSLQRHQLRAHATENSTISNNSDEHLPQKADASAGIQCDLCTTKFQSNASLRRHMRKKHRSSIEQFKCAQCSAVLSNESVRQSHNCSEDLALVCDICKIIFKTKATLRRHMRAKHDPDGYKFRCKSCGAIFTQESSLQGHRCKGRSTSYKDLIPCEACGKVITRGSLKSHRIIFHSEPGTLFCRTCYKIFPSAEELNIHRAECVQKVQIKSECEICKRIYKTKFDLRRHMRAKHSPDIDKYKCQTCGFVFMQELSLQNHKCKGKLTNTNKRELVPCEICNKIVTRGALRTHHIAFHSGTLYCCTCYKVFTNNDDLNAHTKQCRSKVNVKRPCNICNKVLASARALIKHKISLHSPPGTVIYCKTCVKKFKTVEELNAHMPECTLKRKLQKFQKQNEQKNINK